MNRDLCIDILVDLIKRNILETAERERLLSLVLDPKLKDPPVRHVVDMIYKEGIKPISSADRELIDDVMHFFG